MSSNDFFDTEEDGEIPEEQRILMLNYNNLIHELFKQNPKGVDLLDIWRRQFVMAPIVIPGNSPEAHGIREGSAKFVRNIIETIELVEHNYNLPENSDA